MDQETLRARVITGVIGHIVREVFEGQDLQKAVEEFRPKIVRGEPYPVPVVCEDGLTAADYPCLCTYHPRTRNFEIEITGGPGHPYRVRENPRQMRDLALTVVRALDTLGVTVTVTRGWPDVAA